MITDLVDLILDEPVELVLVHSAQRGSVGKKRKHNLEAVGLRVVHEGDVLLTERLSDVVLAGIVLHHILGGGIGGGVGVEQTDGVGTDLCCASIRECCDLPKFAYASSWASRAPRGRETSRFEGQRRAHCANVSTHAESRFVPIGLLAAVVVVRVVAGRVDLVEPRQLARRAQAGLGEIANLTRRRESAAPLTGGSEDWLPVRAGS